MGVAARGMDIRHWLPKPVAATLIVSAYNSLHPERADFHCIGVNDQVVIQAVIDALGAIGGMVVLLEGDYSITSPITLATNVGIRGQGVTATSLRQAAAVNIIEYTGGGLISFPSVESLQIVGDKVTYATGHGIFCNANVYDLVLRDLFISYMPEKGIYCQNMWGHVYIEVVVEYCENYCIQMGSNGKLFGCKIGYSDEIGLVLASNNLVQGCEIIGNDKQGIYSGGANLNSIIGCSLRQNSDGHPGSYADIRLFDAYGNIVKGCIFQGTDHKSAVISNGTSHDNVVQGNYSEGTTGTPFDVSDSDICYQRHSDLFMDVLAASANLIVNAQNFVDGAIALTGVQPKYPRGLVFAITAGVTEYTLTVVGTNGKGQTITEVYTFADDGLAWSSDNAFDEVTSITLADRAGAAATIDVGIDERLGLQNLIYETSDIWKIMKNGVKQIVAAAQVDVEYDTYDMSVITLAATDDFEIWYRSNLNIIG